VQVYYDLSSFPKLSLPVVTIGTFDGVHLGHRTILKRLNEIAGRSGGQSVVITFHPHPRLVLHPEDASLRLLNSLEEKIRLLEQEGIDYLLIIPFDKAFSEKDSATFIEEILVRGAGTKKLVVGYDHHFGKNREGSFENLNRSGEFFGFDVEEIPAKDIDHVAISSTRIRQALQEGDIKTANLYLGYPYRFSGTVVKGAQMGRQIGFPTANLEIPGESKLIPGNGVYAVKVIAEGATWNGMLNIGYRPTVSNEGVLKIEVHIIDFSGDLYGKEIKVELYDRIRGEKKFNGIDQLKAQIANDKKSTLNLLGAV